MAAQCLERRAFYKWLQKQAELRVFDKVDVSKEGWEEEVAVLVQKRAKALDLTFEGEALELFVQLVGEETRQIESELQKLALYLQERDRIELEDVRLMVPASRKGVIR